MSSIDPITPESPSNVGITSSKSHLERLVDSLLFEGYALYPYTPGATKNATPTPFGIVYPADYARHQTHAFDRMQMQGVVTDADALVTGEVRFLQPSGEQHRAVERRVQLGSAPSNGACSLACRRRGSPSSSTSWRGSRRSRPRRCPTAAVASP